MLIELLNAGRKDALGNCNKMTYLLFLDHMLLKCSTTHISSVRPPYWSNVESENLAV